MICQKVRRTITLTLGFFADRGFVGAFYMVGDIDSARQKGEKILADLEKQ